MGGPEDWILGPQWLSDVSERYVSQQKLNNHTKKDLETNFVKPQDVEPCWNMLNVFLGTDIH